MTRNIAAIVSKVIENKEIINAMQYLDNDEQIGFATVLLGCQLTVDDLPGIPDNHMAQNVEVISINPVKDKIGIKYEALKQEKYVEGKWQWIEAEKIDTAYATLDYSTYMKYAKVGYKG